MSSRHRLLCALRVGAALGFCGCAAPPLPPATGPASDILLIDESGTTSAVEALCAALEAPTPDLAPEEGLFRVVHGTPTAPVPRDKNVVLIERSERPGPLLRSALAGAAAARLDATQPTWQPLRDVWARGQEVSLLLGPQAALDSLVVNTAVALRQHLEQSSLERACAATRRDTTTAEARELRRQQGFVIAVPAAYRVVDRAAIGAVELVAAAPTRSVTVFWRDGAPPPGTTASAALLAVQESLLVRLHGDALVTSACRFDRVGLAPERRRLRGAWENRTTVAGGPLVTHFLYDAPRRRLYGVQGLLFAPGQRKRPALIELEALLLTFRLETTR